MINILANKPSPPHARKIVEVEMHYQVYSWCYSCIIKSLLMVLFLYYQVSTYGAILEADVELILQTLLIGTDRQILSCVVGQSSFQHLETVRKDFIEYKALIVVSDPSSIFDNIRGSGNDYSLCKVLSPFNHWHQK